MPAHKTPSKISLWILIIFAASVMIPPLPHYASASPTFQSNAVKAALHWLSSNEQANGTFESFPQIPTPPAALALWLNNSNSIQAAKSFTWIASQLDDSASYAWGEADIPGEMLYALGASNNIGLLHNFGSVSSEIESYQQHDGGFVGYYAQLPDNSYVQVASSVDTGMALWGIFRANSPISQQNRTYAINYLLSLQNLDGSFNLTKTNGQSSTSALGPEPISMTALTLLALRYEGKYTDQDTHVSNALGFLAKSVSENFSATRDHKGHVYGASLSALAFQAYGRNAQAVASVGFILTQQGPDGSFLDVARGSSQKTLDTGWAAVALEEVQLGPLFSSFLTPVVFVGIFVAVGVLAVVSILAAYLVINRRRRLTPLKQ